MQGDSKTYVAVIDNNSCKIPDAVCKSGGRCEMALIGAGYDVINALSSGSTDELKSADVIITTNRCELRFGETVTVNTVNEDESKENPFADVLAKITALSDSYESKQNKTDDALTTKDKNVVGAINETHSKAWDAMSTAETALNYTSDNEMLMGSLDNLTTQEKSTIVGAINEINSNKQAKDFVITGTVTGNLGTGGIDVSDISCTYEEARAAFDGGQNVKCLFYAPELSTYIEFRYKAHSEYAIMFECMFRDYNYLPVFMADGTWDWSFDKAYADKVFCNDIAEYAGFYLQTEFHEETGNRNLTNAIVENRHRIEDFETQIGDINTALETALNGGAS